jgi:hypothetical protein
MLLASGRLPHEDRRPLVEIVSLVVGAVIGTVIGWMGSEFLPILWRRIQQRPPVIIHVETNPAIFEAGLPPWIGYGFVFPGEGSPGPPPLGPCQDWWAWAREHGGIDAGTTKLRLTLVGDDRVTVLVDALQVTIMHQGSPLTGSHVVCPVGGAALSIRRITVDLDGSSQPMTTYIGDSGGLAARFAFQLARGQVEVFNIEAHAERSYCEWQAELFLLVDGKRKTMVIDDNGRSFRTTAASDANMLSWAGEQWKPLHS